MCTLIFSSVSTSRSDSQLTGYIQSKKGKWGGGSFLISYDAVASNHAMLYTLHVSPREKNIRISAFHVSVHKIHLVDLSAVEICEFEQYCAISQ